MHYLEVWQNRNFLQWVNCVQMVKLIPKAAERAARDAWSHLRSTEGNWRFVLIGLEPNIYVIRFENEDDRNIVLYGTA